MIKPYSLQTIDFPCKNYLIYVSITIFVMMIVMPIRHSITIRLFLELFILIFVVSDIIKYQSQLSIKNFIVFLKKNEKYCYLAFLILLIFTIYIILHNFLIATNQLKSWWEFRGQWLRPVVLYLCGIWLAFRCISLNKTKWLVYSIILGLAIIVISQSIDAIYLWIKNGRIPFQMVRLFCGKLETSVVVNMFTAFVFSIYASKIFSKSGKGFLLHFLFLILFIYLFLITVQMGSRNGIIGFIFATGTVYLFIAFKITHRFPNLLKILIFSLSIILFTVIVFLAVKSDKRWNKFIETAKIVYKIDSTTIPKMNNKYYPKLEDGSSVDNSAFERLLWIKEGLYVIKRIPLGYGFGRGSWGDAVTEIVKVNRLNGHSHSGVIDLTVGLGIPGLFFWFIFLGLLILVGIRGWIYHQRAESLFLALLTAGFLNRSLIESVIRDHMFEQFMFIVGVISILSINNQRNNSYIVDNKSNEKNHK